MESCFSGHCSANNAGPRDWPHPLSQQSDLARFKLSQGQQMPRDVALDGGTEASVSFPIVCRPRRKVGGQENAAMHFKVPP